MTDLNRLIVDETDEERFRRIAVKRVNKAVKYIRLLGNLSNKSNYSYDAKDVKKVFNALRAEIEVAELRFSHAHPKSFVLE